MKISNFCIYLILFTIMISILSSCKRTKPILLESEKQVSAEKGASFPSLVGYRGDDNKMRFWICTKKEVNVWQNSNYITVEYKKGGKIFPSPQVFYYKKPQGCALETIEKKGLFGKEYFSVLSQVQEQ